jgi:hypothetical protein
MRLDVRVLGAEDRLCALDRERLGNVDELAAAVVPLTGVAFGVLVGQHGARRFAHGAARIVFRGDQFEVLALARFFVANRGIDRRVARREDRIAQNLHRRHRAFMEDRGFNTTRTRTIPAR